MQIFSSIIRNLWNIWELPVMVLISLLLQVILIPLGYKRKYTSKNWLKLVLWFAYLIADWVATVSLGVLSNNEGESQGEANSPEPRYVIRAFWAPFLLLHLGGPDTITAYSMQDNDLWLRHLLGLLIQAGLAFYVFLRALKPTNLNFLSIPIFVAGILKYGERTWVLRSACTQHLRDLLLPDSNFRHNLDKSRRRPLFFSLKRFSAGGILNLNYDSREQFVFDPLHLLHIAYCFFERNKRVFADVVLSSDDLERSRHYFKMFSSEDAFKVIELELGFMYDFFYTKAAVIHSYWGAVLRFISLSSIVLTVALAFFFCTEINRNGNVYPPADVDLTFSLLFGALALEIYAIILILYSDWSVIWLTNSQNFLAHLTYKTICRFGWSVSKKRWSSSVPQYNLITSCLIERNTKHLSWFWGSAYIRKILSTNSRTISSELKERIFKHLTQKCEEEDEDSSRMMAGWTLKKHGHYDQFIWSLELDSDQSILLWHIATDLCYYSDHKIAASNPVLEDNKSVSDFLTHLLAHRHSLFPNGMSQIRFLATFSDAIEYLEQRKSLGNAGDACKSMLDLDPRTLPNDVKGDKSNSMFYHGCRLAQQLERVEESERWDIISGVWVEMLTSISCECRWYDHAEQLGHGGDLLTHVWLLMMHFGFTKHLYVSVS